MKIWNMAKGVKWKNMMKTDEEKYHLGSNIYSRGLRENVAQRYGYDRRLTVYKLSI